MREVGCHVLPSLVCMLFFIGTSPHRADQPRVQHESHETGQPVSGYHMLPPAPASLQHAMGCGLEQSSAVVCRSIDCRRAELSRVTERCLCVGLRRLQVSGNIRYVHTHQPHPPAVCPACHELG